MNIVVTLEHKWGKDLFYPESDDAKFLSRFTGRPTLLKHQLKMALEKGWQVNVKQTSFDLSRYLEEK